MIKIKTFTGGGIKGVVSAQLANHIELEQGLPFNKICDLLGGTSTGAIVASLLAVEVPARDIVNLFGENGGKIFSSPLPFLRRLYSPKYKIDNLNSILKMYLGDARLGDVPLPLMIFVTQVNPLQTKVYKSWKKENKNKLLSDIITASCAAPTYFNSFSGYVDGGLWANDPSVEMLAEAKRLWPNQQYGCLTIGTGKKYVKLHPNNKGIVFWGKNFVSSSMELQEMRTEYVMDKLLEKNYLKLNPDIVRGDNDMDNSSINNIKNLLADTAEYISSDVFQGYKRFV